MGSLQRLFVLLVLSLSVVHSASVYEKELVIPTYGVEAPDPNPRFYTGRVYQGAQGRIYPYPISDELTNVKQDKSYRAVYLENDYIRICVLPELGGRIFEAVDKTNGYHFFYKQSVIKPSLIGMLGAWISGGVEWNFPHHHRPRTFMPMQYTLKSHDDGSVSIQLAELDYRDRLRFSVTLTLEKDTNRLIADLRFFNPTPFPKSFLYFANPAVHVDSTYQVIFPPEVEYVVQHAKNEFASWPIADGRYGGYDYRQIDISWWKNLPKPVSFFAWDHTSDYFAGYNHGLQAGVAYTADVHLAPGKKFFTFGCGDEGKMWDKMLTDSDGPYLELMAGAYSDNQPDYSWIQPYEVKSVRQIWFPIRNLGGLSYADSNGALFLSASNGQVICNLNSVRRLKDARLQICAGDRLLTERLLDIAPDQPVQIVLPLPPNTAESDLRVTLYHADGRRLMTYAPIQKKGEPMPKPVEPPPPPREVKTVEELYLTALRLVEFHNPLIDPYPYLEEALARDSADVRVNTLLGQLYAQRGMFEEAERHLKTAVCRLSANYSRPKDGEPHYLLGVVQKALHKDDEAYDSFYRAAWNFGRRAAAYFSLAELDCRRGDLLRALEHLNEALAVNTQNTRALNLKAEVLRSLGRIAEADQALRAVAAIDPLDPWLLLQSPSNPAAVRSMETELVQETATFLASVGFYRRAADLLSLLPPERPMVLFDLAFYELKAGEREKAAELVRRAASLSVDYCFPFRIESIEVLNSAIALAPDNAVPHYALGNLLYDLQPQKALACWEKAVALKPAFPEALRNLGFGTAHTLGDHERAAGYYERALRLKPNDARLLYELDVIYEEMNAPLAKRQALFKAYAQAAKRRDDALARRTDVQVLAGRYDEAIRTLRTHHFNVWEGGGEIHNLFVDAHLLRGLQHLAAGRLLPALQDLTAALEYPDNLEVGRPIHDPRSCRTWYFIGMANEALQRHEEARQAYEKAASLTVGGELLFYKAAALEKLGQAEQAAALFRSLRESGETMLRREADIDFFAKFGERISSNKRLAQAHYLIGLGALGLGDRATAKAEFERAAGYNGHNPWINCYLKTLK